MIARAGLYRARVFRTRRLPLPSVAIGNLSVGGAGKTPLAAWIAARFAGQGLRPGILLRGYGADEALVHRRLVPQAIVALSSPTVGRKAQAWGRRPLLLLAFGALAIRGLLFAVVTDPFLLVAVQVFDGITAAVLSVMVPLIVADVAYGSGHFNLAQGVVGTATGIGASLSTVLAGYISDTFGSSIAFTGLASIAALGLTVIWLFMPETRRTV